MSAIPETVSVRVVNVGDTRFVGQYANQRYIIEPGKSVIAPYLAACMWFGDPRAVNVGTRRSTQHRDKEIARLSVQYGLFDDAFWSEFEDAETAALIKTPDEKIPGKPYVGKRHPNLPRAEVYDLADDTRILTVIDDPDGSNLTPPTNAEVEAQATAAEVVAMRDRLNKLEQLLVNQDPAAAQSISADPTLPVETHIDTESLTAELAGDPTPDPEDRPTRDGAPSTPRRKPAAARK